MSESAKGLLAGACVLLVFWWLGGMVLGFSKGKSWLGALGEGAKVGFGMTAFWAVAGAAGYGLILAISLLSRGCDAASTGRNM